MTWERVNTILGEPTTPFSNILGKQRTSSPPFQILSVVAGNSWALTTNNSAGSLDVTATLTNANEIFAKRNPEAFNNTLQGSVDYIESDDWTNTSGFSVRDHIGSFSNGHQAFVYSINDYYVGGDFDFLNRGVAWIRMEYPTAVKMDRYSFEYQEGGAPGTWKLQGSNNDTDFTDVDSRSFTGTYTVNTVYTYQVNTTHIPYKYWRFNVSRLHGISGLYQTVNIKRLKFYSMGDINLSVSTPSATDINLAVSEDGVLRNTVGSVFNWLFNLMIKRNGVILASGLYQLTQPNTIVKL